MLGRTRRTVAALTVAGALAGSVALAAPVASAQQTGLVNVEITNLLNHNVVQATIPVNAAANVCGVSVDVLSSALANGPVTCDARGRQQFTILGFAG